MNKFLVLALVAGSISFSGCASEPTTADILKESANNAQKKADLQKSLAKDIEKGKKLIAKGKERIEEAQEDLEDGNKEVAEGTRLVENSKKILQAQFPELNIDTIK